MKNSTIKVTSAGNAVLLSYGVPVAAQVVTRVFKTNNPDHLTYTTKKHIAEFVGGRTATPVPTSVLQSVLDGTFTLDDDDKEINRSYSFTAGIVVVVEMGAVVDKGKSLDFTSMQHDDVETLICDGIEELPGFKWWGADSGNDHYSMGYPVTHRELVQVNGAMPVTFDVPDDLTVGDFSSMTNTAINKLCQDALKEVRYKKNHVKELWEKFGNVPVDDDWDTLEDFLHFPLGTAREIVWDWFEQYFGVSVFDMLYPIKEKR